MIGEGIHSTNQRRHAGVQENVEVGFFTDPTVCIGCKACEVAVSKVSGRDPEAVFASQR
jgi:Fe-S-cluster-containing dehydrogenase component